MQTYLISCDLHNATDENAALSKAIKDVAESWARPLGATWYIRTDLAIGEIEARIGECLELEDCMLIQPVNEDAVTLNTALRWFSRSSKAPANKANVAPLPVRRFGHNGFDFAQAS